MSEERDKVKRLIERWISAGWQRGNEAILDDLLADGFIDYDPAGRPSDKIGFKEGIWKLYGAFPDFYAKVEDVIWDSDKKMAAVRWSGRGTHHGEYAGHPPTKKLIQFKGIELLELDTVDLFINKRWGEWDGMDLIDQIKS